MKIKISSLCWTLALAGAAISWCAPAQAQNAVTSGAGGRLSVVELRDTSLADALEMIFQAAGNPSHIIDEQAQSVPIAATTLNNIAWDAAVRNLTQLNGFKVSRNASGTYIIEPRVLTPAEGAFPGAGFPGGFPGANGAFPNPGSPFPGGVPSNPFTRSRNRGGRTMAAPSIRTDANSQTRPNVNGRGGGTNPLDPNEGKDYQIIIVRHIYAGGLAQLFSNASVIKTEDFVSPGESGNSGGGSGSGGRGGRSGSSGIGGGIGGGLGSSGSSGGLGGLGGSSGSSGSSGGFGGGLGF